MKTSPLLLLLLSLSCSWNTTNGNSIISTGANTMATSPVGILQVPVSIDHSYSHSYNDDWDTSDISKLISQAVQKNNESDDLDIHVGLDIDVSNSLILDKGLQSILDSLAAIEETELSRKTGITISVSLQARMNRLTATGVAAFFDKLLTMHKNENNDHDNQQHENENEKNNISNCDNHDSKCSKTRVYFDYIDLGLNDIGLHGVDIDINAYTKQNNNRHIGNAALFHSIQSLIEHSVGLHSACPTTIRLDNCGLGPPFCRAIGKGIINSAQNVIVGMKDTGMKTINIMEQKQSQQYKMLKALHLCGNPIGESGTTALAAALKIAPRTSKLPVLHTLDISSCDVGDIGTEALAMAIASNPGCVQCLNLSNNNISDKGAIALAKALQLSSSKKSSSDSKSSIDCLDLSNNSGIGDEGAAALFEAVECGAIHSLLLQSCSIRTKGIEILGEVMSRIVTSNASHYHNHNEHNDHENDNDLYSIINIDISGNKLGTRVGKKKAGYSKAMMSSMNSIGQKGLGFLKTGLKDIVDFGSITGISLESDDEAEEEDISIVNPNEVQISDKCGAILLYDAYIDSCVDIKSDNENYNGNEGKPNRNKIELKLGMRMCNFDDGALDALAAIKYNVRENYGIEIDIDCDMNHGTNEESVMALKERFNEDLELGLPLQASSKLLNMKTRHLEVLDARQRAIDAKNAEAKMNGLFGDDDYDEYSDDNFSFGISMTKSRRGHSIIRRNRQNDLYDEYDETNMDDYDENNY